MKGASILNCLNRSKIEAPSYVGVGGITGMNCGIAKQCYNYGMVEGNYFIGGIAGRQINDESGSVYKIEACHNEGNIQGSYHIGGIVGILEIGSVSQCENRGRIESTGKDETEGRYWSRTGGIIGNLENGSIAQCCNTENGTVLSRYGCVGGVVGNSEADVLECYNLAEVKATDLEKSTNVGGIVGKLESGTINYTYNRGNVDSKIGYIGGITGHNVTGTVKNSYNAGNVTISSTTKPSSKTGIYDKYIGYITGCNVSGTQSNLLNLTITELTNWSTDNIKTYLGNNFKKGSNYPILNWQ